MQNIWIFVKQSPSWAITVIHKDMLMASLLLSDSHAVNTVDLKFPTDRARQAKFNFYCSSFSNPYQSSCGEFHL